MKILWHDGLGMALYAKRLERGKFIWPSPADGAVPISPAQLGYMLEGIDWRHPQRTWRPESWLTVYAAVTSCRFMVHGNGRL